MKSKRPRSTSRRFSRPRLERLEPRTTPSGLVVGAPTGSAPHVQILDEAGTVESSFLAYSVSFRGGVNVAQGDVTGDGTPDVITAPASGRGDVKVFDGSTFQLIQQFSPFGSRYAGGVNLAVGQLVDGSADLVVGTATGRALIKVFDGSTLHEIQSLSPYGRGVAGVNVAVANLDGGNWRTS